MICVNVSLRPSTVYNFVKKHKTQAFNKGHKLHGSFAILPDPWVKVLFLKIAAKFVETDSLCFVALCSY